MGFRNVISRMSGMLLFRMSYVLSILVLMLLMPFTENSSRAADRDPGGEVELSMRQCMELMLSNNLDLKVERFNPSLQENEISKEKAAFDPVARFSLQKSKFIISPTTLLDGVGQNQSYEQKAMDYEASLSKKSITGGL